MTGGPDLRGAAPPAQGADPRTAVAFDNVSIVFGDRPARALALADQGLDRGPIREATGQTLGVHNCSLAVAEGEILVLMGLSGSGKSTLLRAVNGLNPVVRGEARVRMGDGMVSVTHADRQTLRELRLRRVLEHGDRVVRGRLVRLREAHALHIVARGGDDGPAERVLAGGLDGGRQAQQLRLGEAGGRDALGQLRPALG